MRKYPKKCPKCKEYMEPNFPETIGRSSLGAPLTSNPNVDPESWQCDNWECSLYEVEQPTNAYG